MPQTLYLKKDVWELLKAVMIFKKIYIPFEPTLYKYLREKVGDSIHFQVRKIGEIIEIEYKTPIVAFKSRRSGKEHVEVVLY